MYFYFFIDLFYDKKMVKKPLHIYEFIFLYEYKILTYQNSKIYKIRCNTTGLVYIGSTTQSLKQRLDHNVINERHISLLYLRKLCQKKKNQTSMENPFFFCSPTPGLEPGTNLLTAGCSIHVMSEVSYYSFFHPTTCIVFRVT